MWSPLDNGDVAVVNGNNELSHPQSFSFLLVQLQATRLRYLCPRRGVLNRAHRWDTRLEL